MQLVWKKPRHIATVLFSSEIANDHPNCLCKFCFKTKTLNREKVPQNLIFLQLDCRCIIINKETKMWKKKKKEEDQLALHTQKNISLNNSAKVYVLMWAYNFSE